MIYSSHDKSIQIHNLFGFYLIQYYSFSRIRRVTISFDAGVYHRYICAVFKLPYLVIYWMHSCGKEVYSCFGASRLKSSINMNHGAAFDPSLRKVRCVDFGFLKVCYFIVFGIILSTNILVFRRLVPIFYTPRYICTMCSGAYRISCYSYS